MKLKKESAMTTTVKQIQMPSVEQMKGFISGCRGRIAQQQENMEARMRHYYDCVDDYSYGGICDQVADQSINSDFRRIEIMERQINEGKPFVEEFRRQVLCDLDGIQLTDQIVDTRFGWAWIIRDGEGGARFIGLAKKAKTYEAKGVKVMTVVEVVEYVYNCRISKSNNMMVDAVVIDSRIEEATADDMICQNSQKDYRVFMAS